MRLVGIIIKDGKILLIRRVKPGEEYYAFPGGSMEDNETSEAGLKREMKEELGLEVQLDRKLFENDDRGRREIYYLIKEFTGKLEIGSPEKERMNDQNQYHLEWVELSKIKKMPNLYPQEAVKKIIGICNTFITPLEPPLILRGGKKVDYLKGRKA